MGRASGALLASFMNCFVRDGRKGKKRGSDKRWE
jgi:hypothetical protein